MPTNLMVEVVYDSYCREIVFKYFRNNLCTSVPTKLLGNNSDNNCSQHEQQRMKFRMSGRLPIQTRLLVTPIDTQLHMHAPIHESNLYSGPHALVIVTRAKSPVLFDNRLSDRCPSTPLQNSKFDTFDINNIEIHVPRIEKRR